MSDQAYYQNQNIIKELVRQQSINSRDGTNPAMTRTNSFGKDNLMNPNVPQSQQYYAQPLQNAQNNLNVNQTISSDQAYTQAVRQSQAANATNQTNVNSSTTGAFPGPTSNTNTNRYLSPGSQTGSINASAFNTGVPITTTTLNRPGGKLTMPNPQFNSPMPTIVQIARSRIKQVPNFQRSRVIQSAVQLPINQMSSSKVQYIPFERKIVEYINQRRVQRVPRMRKVVDYKEQLVQDVVPRQVIKQDYYAIQHLRQYVAEYIPEVSTQMVKKPVPFKRIQYVPVTRQVYHGAPFGAEGLQNIPFCTNNMAGLGVYGMQGHGWQGQSNVGAMNSMSRLYGGGMGGGIGGGSGLYGTNMYQGGWLASGCCDQYKRKFSSIYDTYDPYIPAFKY